LTAKGPSSGVDSLLARLFDGDDASFYARMAAHGHEIIADADFAGCPRRYATPPQIPAALIVDATATT
jgi:hypothetical protein